MQCLTFQPPETKVTDQYYLHVDTSYPHMVCNEFRRPKICTLVCWLARTFHSRRLNQHCHTDKSVKLTRRAKVQENWTKKQLDFCIVSSFLSWVHDCVRVLKCTTRVKLSRLHGLHEPLHKHVSTNLRSPRSNRHTCELRAHKQESQCKTEVNCYS